METDANKMPSLTDHLASLSTVPPYADATRHPFLVAAADGSLPTDRLALWLSQDRIYASHAYPAFIGSLIASMPRDSSHGIYSREEQKNQHILSVRVFCLQNVVREVNFFRDLAEQWGLSLDVWKERKGTKDYTAEMARISKSGRMEDALIFLWAMERVSGLSVSGHNLTNCFWHIQVYLDAWSFVASRLQSSSATEAVSRLASNWSSSEFIEFVDKLAKLVDNLEIQPGTDAWKRAEAIWLRVVELEVGFWPTDGEDQSHRIDL
jgi:thiaminase